MKLVFWFGKLRILIGIMTFLITISIGNLTYITIWSYALLIATIDVNGINSSSKNKVNLKLLII